ncbi:MULTISPECIES: protein-glutamate O-methyltransferase CheR [unclassified Massilia]|uniref:CheR family methyltransferase n=1 Tax=unclassified Massilia TaxID=2609279 RepID=UPI001B80EB2A|nr:MULTISPECIES: protein-glutamate O-methyltransferase CheR [unclassified Massilia]MBQ5943016.1 protein-glutamate O-methyltransferase CheR [Massilia sp. AB1]MBQ5966103.1 protein-glutamate O-methyltransferase CheR [Massilia sp. ZL223]
MSKPPSDFDIELRMLVEAVYLKYNYDFRDYTGASQKRRVLVAMREMGCDTVSALQAKVLHEPDGFAQLLQYLTIPVTEMFRDPEYFLAVREQVAPFLRTYPSLKIWVAGCSTGEEVYSLAILLKEEGLLERSIIYATDINPQSLEAARRGVFPLERMRLYTENYQKAGGTRAFSDYYVAAYDGAKFDRSLVENVTFADHSLATDSVFSETHFVSCRNVLIYFNRQLQDRVLGLFHESLCHRGFLGLGSKESIDFSSYAQRFEPLARRERLFRKVAS